MAAVARSRSVEFVKAAVDAVEPCSTGRGVTVRCGDRVVIGNAVVIAAGTPGASYRITGSRVDAEDVVQETWLRWHANKSAVERPEAWLTTVTARLALDRCRKIDRQRLTYVSPWLPEPVRTALPVSAHSDFDDPAELTERLDTLRIGLLVLLD